MEERLVAVQPRNLQELLRRVGENDVSGVVL